MARRGLDGLEPRFDTLDGLEARFDPLAWPPPAPTLVDYGQKKPRRPCSCGLTPLTGRPYTKTSILWPEDALTRGSHGRFDPLDWPPPTKTSKLRPKDTLKHPKRPVSY